MAESRQTPEERSLERRKRNRQDRKTGRENGETDRTTGAGAETDKDRKEEEDRWQRMEEEQV